MRKYLIGIACVVGLGVAMAVSGTAHAATCKSTTGAQVCYNPSNNVLTIKDTADDGHHPAANYYRNNDSKTRYDIHNYGGGTVNRVLNGVSSINFRAVNLEGEAPLSKSAYTGWISGFAPVASGEDETGAGPLSVCDETVATAGSRVCFDNSTNRLTVIDAAADENHAAGHYYCEGNHTVRYDIHNYQGLNQSSSENVGGLCGDYLEARAATMDGDRIVNKSGYATWRR